MSPLMQTLKRNNRRATFGLQLTAMVDMFTILLVFLLKSQSSSAVRFTPVEGLKLPISITAEEPIEALKLIVTKQGIFVNEDKILDLKEGVVDKSLVDGKDPLFIPSLFDQLDKHAKNSQSIAEVNETVKFDGKIILQADSELSYGILQQVMYTATTAGYADLKLATIGVQ